MKPSLCTQPLSLRLRASTYHSAGSLDYRITLATGQFAECQLHSLLQDRGHVGGGGGIGGSLVQMGGGDRGAGGWI